MKLSPRTVTAAAAAALALVLAIGGCSNDSSTGKPPGTTSSTSSSEAATLLKQVADAMTKVTGMHVSVAVQGDVPNLRVTKLDGDISNTPQTVATGTATLLVGKSPEDAKFVYIDGHLYSDLGQPGTYTDFGNGASIYNVSVLLDPTKGWPICCRNCRAVRCRGPSRSTASQPPRSPVAPRPTTSPPWPAPS